MLRRGVDRRRASDTARCRPPSTRRAAGGSSRSSGSRRRSGRGCAPASRPASPSRVPCAVGTDARIMIQPCEATRPAPGLPMTICLGRTWTAGAFVTVVEVGAEPSAADEPVETNGSCRPLGARDCSVRRERRRQPVRPRTGRSGKCLLQPAERLSTGPAAAAGSRVEPTSRQREPPARPSLEPFSSLRVCGTS